MPYDSQSVLTRAARPPDEVLAYGPGPEQVCDVWWTRPAPGERRRPLVLLIHGGFWRAEYDRRHALPMAEALADAGFVVALVEYARVGMPGGGWPGTFDDVADAVDRLPQMINDAARYELSRPVLVGHSAGGQLALWAGARHRLPPDCRWHRAEPIKIDGVVGLAPVACLGDADRTGVGGGAVARLMGGHADDHPDRYALADPFAMLPAGTPTVLVHGDQDPWVPIEQSRMYAAAATAAGDHVRLLELEGVEHYGVIDPLSTAWPAVLQSIDLVAQTGDPGSVAPS